MMEVWKGADSVRESTLTQEEKGSPKLQKRQDNLPAGDPAVLAHRSPKGAQVVLAHRSPNRSASGAFAPVAAQERKRCPRTGRRTEQGEPRTTATGPKPGRREP